MGHSGDRRKSGTEPALLESPRRTAKATALILLGFAVLPAVICFYVAREFGPIDFPSPQFATQAYVLAFYAPFAVVIAALFLQRRGISPGPTADTIPLIVIQVLVVLSVAYVFAAAWDAIVSRKVLELGLAGAKHAAINDGPRNSAIGALNVLLPGAPVVLAGIAILQPLPNRTYRTVVAGLLIVGIGCSLLTGGRNPMVMSAIYLVAVVIIKLASNPTAFFRDRTMVRGFGWMLGLGLSLGIAYILWSSAARGVDRHQSIVESIRYFKDNYKVDFDIPAWLPEGLYAAYYGALNIVFYLAHSIVYLDEYFARGLCPATDGAQAFDIYFRAVDFFFHTNFVEKATESMLLPGIYLSLPGTLYLDFCWFAPFVGAILAVVAAVLVVLSLRDITFAPPAAFVLTVLALAPLYSAFTASNGLSLFVISVVALVAAKVGKTLPSHSLRGAASGKS